MKNKDFAVFILSHGRPDRVITAKTLKDCGYSGEWYIVIDNEDETEYEYRKKYKQKILQFDKLAISKTFDTMDTQQDRRTIVYARNACFELAKQIGVRYFLELDDDYSSFEQRYIEQGKLKVKKISNLDKVVDLMIECLKTTGADTVAFAQGGDFIGGKDNPNFSKGVLRKAMNTFFCDAEKPFSFIGRINEDVNTYCLRGSVGWLGFTTTKASITQKQTQKNKGGMSDVYLDSGTYVKSFYSIMCMPSAVKIGIMGDKHQRIHHNIKWNNCVPKIISEDYKKAVKIDGTQNKG